MPTRANSCQGIRACRLFLLADEDAQPSRNTPMNKTIATKAERIAQAAMAFERRRTGHAPQSVTVVLSENTLVITLHGALTAGERTLAQTPAGAAKVQEFHRQLFLDSADTLRQEIKRITGVEVRQATTEVEPTTGTVVQAFTSGTVVQVFLLAANVTGETWSGTVPSDPS
jgi:uncharacterized protein YbcI